MEIKNKSIVISKEEKAADIVSCSSMLLTSKEGNPYWFRTCDLNTNLWWAGAHIVSFPAGHEIQFEGNNTADKSKYKILGVTYSGEDTWLLDGINSEGLIGGLLFLNEGTSVKSACEGYTGVMALEVITKLLANCADVNDVIEQASKMQVLSISMAGQSLGATMHYSFTDKLGKTVILEADDSERPGIFRIYTDDENIGVMTNSPSYNKQIKNLQWYISQSPELKCGINGEPITSLIIDGKEIKGDENAEHVALTGTFPGTYCSYDRFVRLAVLKALNDDGRNISDYEMIIQGTGIMNAVYAPHTKGVFHYAKFDENMKPVDSKEFYTQYLVMYNLREKELYMKAYDDIAWTKYSLNSCPDDKVKKFDVNHNRLDAIINA